MNTLFLDYEQSQGRASRWLVPDTLVITITLLEGPRRLGLPMMSEFSGSESELISVKRSFVQLDYLILALRKAKY